MKDSVACAGVCEREGGRGEKDRERERGEMAKTHIRIESISVTFLIPQGITTQQTRLSFTAVVYVEI